MSLARAFIFMVTGTLIFTLPALAQNVAPASPPPGAAAPPADQAVDDEQDATDDAEEEATPPPQPRRQVAPSHQRLRERPRPMLDQQRRAMPAAPAQAARPQQTRPQPVVRQQSGDGLPPLDDLTATRERPLFSSTRRPPEPEEQHEAAAPIAEGATMPFELVGVVIGDDVSAAIFRNTESKEEVRVARGDKIGKWNLEEVATRAVVLRGGDKRVRMRLFDQASAPGIQVGRINAEGEPQAGHEDEEAVDEDIAPSNSPQVKPATAQPKPPPSVQQEQRRRQARPRRGNQQRQRGQP